MNPDAEERLATAFERLVDSQPLPQMGYADPRYQQRLKDEGYFDEFAKPLYQNGKESPATGLSKDIIAKVNALRDGKYIGGHVTVNHDSRGHIYLSYKSATPDDRFRNRDLFANFDELINKITAEMAASA